MRVKIDENLPDDLAALLTARGFDADSAVAEGLTGQDDPVIWAAAQKEGRLLVTQDLDSSDARRFRPGTHAGILPLDFGGQTDLRRFRPGTHAGILLIRLRDPNRRRLIERACSLFESAEARSWTGCVVVATDRKVRVRRQAS